MQVDADISHYKMFYHNSYLPLDGGSTQHHPTSMLPACWASNCPFLKLRRKRLQEF
jgi:hypothetical protein